MTGRWGGDVVTGQLSVDVGPSSGPMARGAIEGTTRFSSRPFQLCRCGYFPRWLALQKEAKASVASPPSGSTP